MSEMIGYKIRGIKYKLYMYIHAVFKVKNKHVCYV